MTDKLNEYSQKRNFQITPEPQGKSVDSGHGLRFVVQHHLARRDHYDFRLEFGGTLLSWAVPKGPSYNTGDKRLAIQVEDHPLEYRNFEGIIPKGQYGGGVVMIWDEGWWEPYTDVAQGLKEGVLKFVLKGTRLKGKWALVRIKAKAGESKENWLLLKEKDEYAQANEGITQFTTSVRTGRTMAEIDAGKADKAMGNPFSRVNVQLAKLVDKIPSGDEWLYELKYDGYRIVAFIAGNTVLLITRNGNDYTKYFRDAAHSLLSLAAGRAMVLDGEMVITDASGKTDFQALQNYLKSSAVGKLTYIVFDLLALDGQDLRKLPLTQRKEQLEALMQNAPKNLHYSRHVRGQGKQSYAAACASGMEGIVGKRADSIYSGTRNGDWIKLKCDKRQEFAIGGFTLTDKKTSGVSALLLGFYEGDELIYAGRAGTGLKRSDMASLEQEFRPIIRSDSPFRFAPKTRANEKITWLEPELVAEIKFAQWTDDHLLRQASFKGLRRDKNPKEIQREKAEESDEKLSKALQSQPEEKESPMPANPDKPIEANAGDLIIEGVKISNPDKVIFTDPLVTKGEVIQYYAEVARRMLPFVSRRVLSIVRCPKGIAQTCFYKKHPGPGSKGIVTIPVAGNDGEEDIYFYIEDKAGLIAEAQMGTLEFHTWGSRVEQLEKPDMMVFDLDPDEGLDLSRVRQGVLDIRQILTQLSLKAYLKTSGGKGYHVVVPLQPAVSWEEFHDFARGVAEVMAQTWPERYTSNVRKSQRTNKIFIDWIRNGRGATSIAPYSIRARKGARVSMPIAWEELDRVAPDAVTMAEALLRIKGDDPWKDFYNNNQMLKKVQI
jgi:bifunctional non-homologous end joining protein LigD